MYVGYIRLEPPMTTITNGAMTLEEKLEKIQESLLVSCTTGTIITEDQQKLAT